MRFRTIVSTALSIGLLTACGSSDQANPEEVTDLTPPVVDVTPTVPAPVSALDQQLRLLIDQHGLTGDPSTGRLLPSITDPLAQLGKKLFFTKALGGELDSACVTCHHPMLGGADALSLSVGVGAIDSDLLGPGREDATGLPNVPRNAPTTFNIGLWDSSLFMDSRVESVGKDTLQNGAASGISTPDSGFSLVDVGAGGNLVVAQALFPVTSAEEMRAELLAGESNAVLRTHLAARIGDYGSGADELLVQSWLNEFQTAYSSNESAQNLVTFEAIATALSEYERSQVFVNNAWRDYVQGDTTAISDAAKQGAILFYTDVDQNGAGCVQCHSGDFFTDELHHTVGAPQFGPGKGNPNNHDFGRENINGDNGERFRMRTPTLLNIEVTGPYMHTGAYESLQQVLTHYNNPANTVRDFFDNGGWCQLDQFELIDNCAQLYPNAEQNSELVLARVNQERNQGDPAALPNININNGERADIVAFLRTLTDPCVVDRACLAPWIPEPNEAADEFQLNAIDVNGNRF